MSSNNPIHRLTHEHKYILKVVHGLSVIDDALARGQQPDLARVRTIVGFMRDFADKCHHAKEEAILFPALEHKGVPPTGCPLEGLRREHIKGRELVGALAAAADASAQGHANAVAAMRSAIGGIQLLYPNHIWKEDEMVFPMAERLFSPDELEAMGQQFDQAEEALGQDHDHYMRFADDMAALLGQAPG